MIQHELSLVGSGNYRLHGVLTLPKGVKKPPLVIMCHGFGWGASESTSYKPLILPLAKKGIASYYYDRMGVGKSGGNFAETKHSQDLKDLKIVIDRLLTTQDFSSHKIALFGASAGGFLSILHAAKDKRIRYMCLKVPAIKYQLFWQLRPGFNSWKKTNKIYYIINQTGEKKPLKYGFYKDLLKLDPFKAATKITIPISIISAEKDKRIPISYTRDFLKRVSSKDKTLISIKNANHFFKGHRREANRAIINWLAKKLT